MSRDSKARIIGMGSYVPKKILTNRDLEKLVDTTDEWIVSRTGIRERHIAEEHEYTSDMGAEAGRRALAAANVAPEEIDLILVATTTPDYPMPSTAALIQPMLGASCPAADIQAVCTGFLYGLSMAKAYIEAGIYRRVLLIASEKMSMFLDYEDRTTCVLFGDGAAAAVVSDAGAGLDVSSVRLGADGEQAKLIVVPAGGAHDPATEETVQQHKHYFKMMGREVFKHAVRRMTAAAHECMEQLGVTEEQINWLVPHQANERIIDAIAKNAHIPMEKIYKNVAKYGNTSAASVGIALDELMQEKAICDGDRLLLVAFGSGLTWGASILTKVND